MHTNSQITYFWSDDDIKVVHVHVHKNETAFMSVFLFFASIGVGKWLLNRQKVIK
jgi:hypothetical protein